MDKQKESLISTVINERHKQDVTTDEQIDGMGVQITHNKSRKNFPEVWTGRQFLWITLIIVIIEDSDNQQL